MRARPGLMVAGAMVGWKRRPGGMEIGEAKLRGASRATAVLCSAKELALSDKSDGLLELDAAGDAGPADQRLPQPQGQCPASGDHAQSRRPPGAGSGARCRGAVQRQHEAPNLPPAVVVGHKQIKVDIDDLTTCPTYTGRVISKINPQGTHAGLDARSACAAAACAASHPLVDITNYVMLELARPLHAFDLDKISGSVRVRPCRAPANG